MTASAICRGFSIGWGTDVVLASDPAIATLNDDESSHQVMSPETALWIRQ
ncbi:MAG: hypothetical protein GY911_03360 [Actinomycetales bacterium]|nr:hypothetical protein [Actinomycetales bacterium]